MKKILALSLAAAVAAGCAGTAQVRVDRDPAADMRSYRTFAFYEQAAGGDRYRSLLSQHLTAATRRQLEAAGYVYDESAPQLRVNIVLRVAEKVDISSTSGSSPMYRHRGWGPSVETNYYKVGTLRIDLVDAHRRSLVWRGVAESRLGDQEMAEPGPAVDRAVAGIFAKFEPPVSVVRK